MKERKISLGEADGLLILFTTQVTRGMTDNDDDFKFKDKFLLEFITENTSYITQESHNTVQLLLAIFEMTQLSLLAHF